MTHDDAVIIAVWGIVGSAAAIATIWQSLNSLMLFLAFLTLAIGYSYVWRRARSDDR
jgi:hypothetical protein